MPTAENNRPEFMAGAVVSGSSHSIPPNKKPPARGGLFGGRCRTRTYDQTVMSGRL